MTITLPPTLKDYFAAKAGANIEAMLAPFCRRRGRPRRGQDASWPRRNRRMDGRDHKKYRVSVEPTEASSAGDQWTVAGLVSGNFPGSPATLSTIASRWRATGSPAWRSGHERPAGISVVADSSRPAACW